MNQEQEYLNKILEIKEMTFNNLQTFFRNINAILHNNPRNPETEESNDQKKKINEYIESISIELNHLLENKRFEIQELLAVNELNDEILAQNLEEVDSEETYSFSSEEYSTLGYGGNEIIPDESQSLVIQHINQQIDKNSLKNDSESEEMLTLKDIEDFKAISLLTCDKVIKIQDIPTTYSKVQCTMTSKSIIYYVSYTIKKNFCKYNILTDKTTEYPFPAFKYCNSITYSQEMNRVIVTVEGNRVYCFVPGKENQI